MVRDILVPLQYTGTDAAALDAAAALAAAHEAQVAVLATVAHPVPFATEWGMAAMAMSQSDFDAARAGAQKAADAAGQRVRRAGAACEVRVIDSVLTWPEEAMAMHARHADLSVLGGPDPLSRNPRFGLNFSTLLMDTGRPVLLMPANAKLAVPPRRVVLAWQPRRECARALHDALTLLPADARVDVLVVDPVVGELQYGEQPGADIARHLVRHGCQVQVMQLPREGRDTGTVIADYARRREVDLVVMGGYGHSRWREQVLGGTTRRVLEQATVPVLLSH